MKASVVIATYNREEDLVRAIGSVFAQKFDSFELIVVDQTKQHKPETEAFLQGIADKRFRYFRVTPPSLPAARNFAIARAKGEVVVFIDDDVTLAPGFIKAHCDEYTSSKVGGAAGRVVGVSEEPSATLFHMTAWGGKRGSYNFLERKEAWSARGCNMSFRLSVLKELHGFDTGFRGNALCEDVDMSLRVREAGYSIMFTPHAEQMHYDAPEGGCREDGPTFNYLMAYLNDSRFFYKHFKLRWLPRHLVYIFFRYGPLDRNILRAFKRVSFMAYAPFVARYQLHKLPEIKPIEVAK